MLVTMKLHDREGDVVEVSLPGRYEVCPRCGGKGSIVNPAVDGNGLSDRDFEEDPDFEEAYFSGVYDIPCLECFGKKVIAMPDVARCSFAQKRLLVSERLWQKDEFDYLALCRSEQRALGIV